MSAQNQKNELTESKQARMKRRRFVEYGMVSALIVLALRLWGVDLQHNGWFIGAAVTGALLIGLFDSVFKYRRRPSV